MSNLNKKNIIAANWKMNKNLNESIEFAKELMSFIKKPLCDIFLFIPTINLNEVSKILLNSHIKVGAQNCYLSGSGAFTGEISVNMLTSLNINNVLLGHSERRAIFCETNENINQKVRSAINSKMNVILCVGETFDEKNLKIGNETIAIQLKTALNGINFSDIDNIIIAYEPVWAIGTGKTPDSEDVNNICKFIRFLIKTIYNNEIAEKMKIIYGGSVNKNNAKNFLSKSDINGLLLGGASLDINEFKTIINIAGFGFNE